MSFSSSCAFVCVVSICFPLSFFVSSFLKVQRFLLLSFFLALSLSRIQRNLQKKRTATIYTTVFSSLGRIVHWICDECVQTQLRGVFFLLSPLSPSPVDLELSFFFSNSLPPVLTFPRVYIVI